MAFFVPLRTSFSEVKRERKAFSADEREKLDDYCSVSESFGGTTLLPTMPGTVATAFFFYSLVYSFPSRRSPQPACKQSC